MTGDVATGHMLCDNTLQLSERTVTMQLRYPVMCLDRKLCDPPLRNGVPSR